MKRLLLPAALLLSSAAWADLPPPDASGCSGKQANASCETDDQKAGACQQSKCWRNDYSKGPPPTAVEYDCLTCVASSPPPDTKSPAAEAGGQSTSSCAAAPATPLFLAALLAGWLIRGKRRIV
ncbi:hypothetical protein [Hyalangium sp.]|uniref:hypothetical protein n=1 Tax=Hyalangium sp. TaxID=2028555 RepID=UPI002D65E62A|nr:hypothetical protein [Hyalangium sp.]HYH99585.1 hypothetical protein [Hyalangium sp.]